MSPRQLLEKLESLGSIDEKALDKIRKQVEDPNKKVKPKAVLSYLIKKGELTKKQASRLLKSKPKKATPTADEIEVVQPVEKDYDTNALMGISPEEVVEPVVEPIVEPVVEPIVEPLDDAGEPIVVPQETIMDGGALARVVGEEPVQPVEMTQVVTPIDSPMDGGLDGFGMDDFGGSGAEQQTESNLASFAGKRNQRDQWATKWLYIGFGILGTLAIGLVVLYFATSGQTAEDMYEAASTSFNNQSWGDATKKYEAYLERFPNHKDAATARARRIHSIIRGTFGTKNWSEVIQQSNTLLPELETEGEKLDILRDDLAVMLPSSLVEISTKATKLTDLAEMEKKIEVINTYKATVDKPQYVTSSARKIPSVAANFAKIDNNIKTVVGQIDKEKRYNSDRQKIAELGEQGETAAAFATYQKLIRNYGDLASRKPIRQLMLEISAKESALVKPAEVNIATAAEERPSLIQKTVVLGTRTGEALESLKGETIAFLADGSVYGIDAGEGIIKWRRHVGFATDIQPQPVNEDFLCIGDQEKHEVAVISKDTGAIKWRAEIGEPFMSPTVADKVIVVTTQAGKIIQFNAANGAVEQTAQLPRQQERLGADNIVASTSSMVASRDPYVYQVGYSDNLYIISSRDYSCQEVYYLGHSPGSISVPPVAWQGYILVCINGGDHCNLLVLKGENGREIKPVQMLSRITDGPITTPIARFGRWMLLNSDNGQLKILELSPNSEQSPVTQFGNGLDVEANQPTFTLTEGSNIWVADRAIARCKVKRSGNGAIDRPLILEPNDTFISPMQKLDDHLFHVRRRNNSGMISASLVDSKTLKPVWRTDFGGELAGPMMKFGDSLVAVSNQGDLFEVDGKAIESGYVDAKARASTIVENLKFKHLIPVSKNTFACLGPAGSKDLLLGQGSTGQVKLGLLAPPADKPVCPPLAMGSDLIVASSAGFVSRINPANGQLVGTPFQPEVRPANAINWFEPTRLSEEVFAIAAGALDDGSGSALYLLSVANKKLVTQVGAFSDPGISFRSRLVNNEKQIFAVIGKGPDEFLASITANQTPAVSAEVPLNGSVVAGPWITKSGLLVQLDDDKLYCFGVDLSKKWNVEIPNDKLATNPTMAGSQLVLTFSSGKVAMLDAASGELAREFKIGEPIVHEPLRNGDKTVFAGRDGTVHVVDFSRSLEQ